MTTDHRLSLPGVSADYLAKAKVDRIEANSAFQFCGIRESGMVFPYFNFHGEAVEDGGIEFARLRLDQPRGDQKYHQRSGSAPHAYLPPSIWGEDKNLNNPILVVEGEKKALALAEEGFTAIALGGFYNFRDGTGELVPEIVEFLHYVQDPFFIFLGDQDVVFNYQFSHAARTFGQLVAPASVLVSCVPLAAPGKGIDDCRHALGTDFKPWMVEHVYSGAVIDSKSTAGSVAWELLRLQVPTLVGMEGVKRDEARRGLSKLAAGLRGFPLEQNNVTETAEKLGVGRNIFKRLVKQENRRSVMENVAEELGGDTSKVIDLGEQPGTWTRDVLEVVGPQTYLFGDNLCDLSGGAFKPHTPASLVPRLDSKDCCRFVRVNSSGEASRTQLSEKETRLVLGALEQHKKFLQPVKTLAQAPVLSWSENGPELIVGYSREHQLVATQGVIELPGTSTAVAELLELTQDFDFATSGDAGRAIAFLLTPALICGRFLNSGRSPFFFIEKDQKGAGAGTFMRMLAAIYAAKPCSITPDNPRSAREDLSKHLLEGANFIYLDNIRGKVLTTLGFLESLLTEPVFTCRAPYLHGAVNVTYTVIACTSNGAVLSPDLADRTVKITIRKRSENYKYHPWAEGDFIDHVTANNLRYLACVYSVIKAWAVENRPDGLNLSGFRFRQWERACAWILENFFGSLPLLDAAHKTAQEALVEPDRDLLRAVFRAVVERNLNAAQSATDLVRLAVQIGRMEEGDEKSSAMKMGRILTREFPRPEFYEFANEFRVRRCDKSSPESNYESLKTYFISPLSRQETTPQPFRMATPQSPISLSPKVSQQGVPTA